MMSHCSITPAFPFAPVPRAIPDPAPAGASRPFPWRVKDRCFRAGLGCLGLAVLCLPPALAAAANGFSPESLARIKTRNNLTDALLQEYLPYLHPPVQAPVREGISLAVPTGLGNPALAAAGIVDATAAPFSADPTGQRDATRAIQAAVNFARDHQMIVFLPAGDYTVSDTILCLQKLTVRGNGTIGGASEFPCVLTGSTVPGRRSTIRLAPKARGFDRPDDRKIVIHFQSCSNGGPSKDKTKGPLAMQGNISYNNVFADIDLVVGPGNPGAVGIRMHGAEGSSIQNVTIDATHGHTGMLSAAGGGGSHHNLTVIGGRIGIDTRGYPPEFRIAGPGTQPSPTMAHVTLTGQTETPLYVMSRGPFVGVGWRITVKPGLAAIVTEQSTFFYNSTLCLVDSVIEYEQPSPLYRAIAAQRGHYLRNVYVKNAALITEGVRGSPTGWIGINELAIPVTPKPLQGAANLPAFQFDENPVVDFVRRDGPIINVMADLAPPGDLCERHIWKTLPSWQSPGAANVKARYGAKGDGLADDTRALQQAIDENEIVFLPKGYYRISDTLRLKANTKLVGVAQHLSTVMACDPFDGFLDGRAPRPLIETADTADASTVLSMIGTAIMPEVKAELAERARGVVPCYAIHWRCGGDSFVRMAQSCRVPRYGYPLRRPENTATLAFGTPMIQITGHGGGKWYNHYAHGAGSSNADFRHMRIANCEGPLAFYHFHAQHQPGPAQCEIVDSANLDFYGIKCEYETGFVRVRRSRHIRFFGFGGLCSARPGTAHFLFENSDDYLVSNFGDQLSLKNVGGKSPTGTAHGRGSFEESFPLREVRDGRTFTVPSLSRPIVTKRGTP